MQKLARVIFLLSSIFLPVLSFAQVIATEGEEILEYNNPKDYEIGGITVLGATYSDANAISSISGLKIGDKIKIPGPKTQQALKALWKLRLFTNVEIIQEKTIGDIVFLQIKVEERPRLSKYAY